jgi:hypothetical protein
VFPQLGAPRLIAPPPAFVTRRSVPAFGPAPMVCVPSETSSSYASGFSVPVAPSLAAKAGLPARSSSAIVSSWLMIAPRMQAFEGCESPRSTVSSLSIVLSSLTVTLTVCTAPSALPAGKVTSVEKEL